MKMKADQRNWKRQRGKGKWNLMLHDAMLLNASDATQGVIGKFQRPYKGPYNISKLVNPNLYELLHLWAIYWLSFVVRNQMW
jgi:hypothetical protein